MHPKALITVVVPSFNQGPYLEQCLMSLSSQTVPVNIYLFDGGSTDSSLAVIQRWSSKLSYWRSAPDGGQVAAINLGLSKATTPYISWLNADDVLLPRAYERLLTALQAQPHAPFAYAGAIHATASLSRLLRYNTKPFSEYALARGCIVCQPATLIRNDVWRQVNGLDERWRMAFDYDLWWRMYRAAEVAPIYIPEVIALVRHHHSTKTNLQPELHYAEALAIVRKHFGRVPRWWYMKKILSVTYRKLFRYMMGFRR